MNTAEDHVLAANTSFYEAFRERDLAFMDQLWANEHVVACAHPGWQVLYGRSEVMASWRAILDNEESPPIICSDAHAFVIGEAAFVTCTETLSEAELVATNVFARENGRWKLVHHQASPVARRVELGQTPLN